MVSIIIASRVDQYLQQTIDDLLVKAGGDVEIIVVLDGYWPNPMVQPDKRVKVIHQGTQFNNLGMRSAINTAASLAEGEYIMKIDEHCMVDQDYDLKLIQDCKPDWVVIPRRYRLDAENWKILEDGRPPVDYMSVDYPYQRPYDKTCGLHGAEWKRPDRAKYEIDDTPSMQGSCWFMRRDYFWNFIGPLDEKNYGTFTQEAQEICHKAWFSGGRVVVNKRTWYAHYHKGKRGKGYGFSNAQYKQHLLGTEKGRLFCIKYWLNTKDYIHDWKWFVNEKFPNMPGWENWEERIKVDQDKDFSATYGEEYKPQWELSGRVI